MKRPELYLTSQVDRCIICNDAPCSKACKQIDVASVIRSVRFGNITGAATKINNNSCITCETQNCIKVCNRNKIDNHIDIPFIIKYLYDNKKSIKADRLPSLEIDFCGIKCENPFILGSSVISSSYDMCKRAFLAGWAGASIKTISYIDIHEASPRFDIHSPNQFPFIGFKNLEQLSPNLPEYDFAWIKQLKEEFPSKLIIASIMGSNEKEWSKLALMAEAAKADIIECNFSCPQMVGKDLGSDIGQNSKLVEQYTKACSQVVKIPVLAKLTPNLALPDNFIKAAYQGGAAGIAGINTIKCLTSVDFSDSSTNIGVSGKSAVSGYSGKAVKPIALRFIRDTHIEIKKHISDNKDINISGIGGVETWRDALDFILLGASNVQVCTAVMQYGYRIIDDLCNGLKLYMLEHNIAQLKDLVSTCLPNIVEPGALDRKNIKYPHFNHKKCIGCGRCYLSCMDGGHQAISMKSNKPILDKEHCVGCHLCRFVCITQAITAKNKIV